MDHVVVSEAVVVVVVEKTKLAITITITTTTTIKTLSARPFRRDASLKIGRPGASTRWKETGRGLFGEPAAAFLQEFGHQKSAAAHDQGRGYNGGEPASGALAPRRQRGQLLAAVTAEYRDLLYFFPAKRARMRFHNAEFISQPLLPCQVRQSRAEELGFTDP
jgi:hypothetical protein